MKKEEAIEIIEQAVNAGVLKGVYSLEDMKLIVEAIKTLSCD